MIDAADVQQALRQGDLVEVHWIDATEESTGDVDAAVAVERVSYGIFWVLKDQDGCPLLVTTTTIDRAKLGQSGYCAYPLGMIRQVKLIRRGRKGKKNGYTS